MSYIVLKIKANQYKLMDTPRKICESPGQIESIKFIDSKHLAFLYFNNYIHDYGLHKKISEKGLMTAVLSKAGFVARVFRNKRDEGMMIIDSEDKRMIEIPEVLELMRDIKINALLK